MIFQDDFRIFKSSNNPTSPLRLDNDCVRLVSAALPSSVTVCSYCSVILIFKGYLGHKACKSHRDYSASPSLSGPSSLFYCILSYLLTNIKYSLREFISLVTNTELSNSAFVYNDVYLYRTLSFLFPVCLFFF